MRKNSRLAVAMPTGSCRLAGGPARGSIRQLTAVAVSTLAVLGVVPGCWSGAQWIPIERHNDMTDLSSRPGSRYRLASDIPEPPYKDNTPEAFAPNPAVAAVSSGAAAPTMIGNQGAVSEMPPASGAVGPSVPAATSGVMSQSHSPVAGTVVREMSWKSSVTSRPAAAAAAAATVPGVSPGGGQTRALTAGEPRGPMTAGAPNPPAGQGTIPSPMTPGQVMPMGRSASQAMPVANPVAAAPMTVNVPPARGQIIPEADRLLAEAAAVADRPSGEPDAQRLGRAAGLLRHLITTYPNSDKVEHAWVRLGVIAEHPSRRDFGTATGYYQRAVSTDPNSDAWFRAALIYEGPLADAGRALEMYRGATQFDPDPERRRQAAAAVARLSGR